MEKKTIYFDYAATTPVAPEVERAMRPYFGKRFGNPGSVHTPGQKASAAVFHARQTIAKALGARYQEIIFTGSATEANNLVLRGMIAAARRSVNGSSRQLKIIVSVIEHESILETARELEREGIEVVMIPVTRGGLVRTELLARALDERTILVSIMYANNEIGTIQPIAEIGALIAEYKKSGHGPLFHTDAVQALQYLDCDVNRLGIDFMTISAHKIYGPKGIGALYVKNHGLKQGRSGIEPTTTGGGQESGLRSGTENVPLIVGFAKAIELSERNKKREAVRVAGLRNKFLNGMKKIVPRMTLNGALRHRLPNNANIYLPGSSAHDRCIELDLLGIAVSPGVACSARSAVPSYVIEALSPPGGGNDRPRSSLRFTFGRDTTTQEIDQALHIIKRLTKR